MFHYKSNIGYYAKIFVLPIAAGLLFILACGDDDPEPPSLSEQLVGSWEIISIDGKTLEESLNENEIVEDYEDVDIDIDEVKYDVVFAANGSVFANFGVSVSFVFTGGAVSATISATIAVAGRGTYILSGSTLTMVWEDVSTDASIELEPEEFWAQQGVTEEELEKGFKEEFEEEFDLGFDIENQDIDLSGDWLTLTASDGDKMVLKKR